MGTDEPDVDVATGLDMLLTDGALGPLRRMLPATSGIRMAAKLAGKPVTVTRRAAGLATELARIGVGSSEVAPNPKDKRYADPLWTSNPLLRRLVQAHIATGGAATELVEDAGLDWADHERVQFAVGNLIDALAPSNSLLNPVAWRAAIDTRGASVVRGARRLINDMSSAPRVPTMVEPDAFTVGEDMACTPGAVVLRTPVFELIQYLPSTSTVREIPLLLVPPWVNKYYLFDLQKKSSFIKWAVDQGFTLFVISWVNPDARHSEKDFENYWLEGPYAALQAIEKITGERCSHIVSYCLGGTLTVAGLAHLATTGEADRVNSATMIATMTDFAQFGDFEAFVTEEQIKTLEEHLQHKGYVDSADLTRLFALLRANDLIWSSGISSYLLAEDAVASDLLYWFADGIGMPAKMLRTFMRSIILNNSLTKPGALAIDGVPIDLKDIRTPLFFVSLRDDHVAGWQDTYRGASRFDTQKRFILGGSGHNAGTINPPAAKKHGYWTNPEMPADAESWFKNAKRNEGSWWPEWAEWLKERCGGEVAARGVGDGPLPILEAAPGSYVKARH